MRRPFLIYKRTVRGKKHLYVKFWDENVYDYSIRKSAQSIKDSLGPKGARFPCTSKAGADALARLWLSENPIDSVGEKTLLSYLRRFWTEESDYIKGKILRGQNVSKEYLGINEAAIEKRFMVFMENTKATDLLLSDASPALLESFINYLSDLDANLSNRRINQIVQAVKVPIAEAHRLGMISSDPGKAVKKLPEKVQERVIFTMDEAKKFLQLADDPLHKGINLLAATTGMRLGECRGLLRDDIKDGEIDVKHNWIDKEGLKAPKSGSFGRIAIPAKTEEALKELIRLNPYGNDFIFWGNTSDKPISKDAVSKYYNFIVDKMGITDRVKRGLGFHAWRHYYNSNLRGKIPDHLLRGLTRHSSKEMTDKYTHVTEEQRKAVSELADKII